MVFTSPGNISIGFATTTVTCNTGDTAISGQEVIIPLVRNFFPGSGGPFESLGGSYMSGFASFSNPPSNNAWTFQVYGNNLRLVGAVTCFDN